MEGITVKSGRERIIFDIIRDGDNTLRGAIGEKILEYLLREYGFSTLGSLKCYSLNNLSFYSAIEFIKDYEYIVSTHSLPLENFTERVRGNLEHFRELYDRVISRVQKLRKKFGVKDSEFKCYAPPMGLGYCYICGKRDYRGPLVIVGSEDYLKENPEIRRKRPHVHLCPRCLEIGIKKGIVIRGRIGFRVHPNYLEDFAYLWLACNLNTYKDLIPFIIKLGNYVFLLKLRGGGAMGKFDYICIDKDGNRYLIDVKTTTSPRHVQSVIYKKKMKSKDIIYEALKHGFKVLIPLVKFLDN